MNPAEVRAALEANLSLNATLERLGIQRAHDRFDNYDYVDASGVVLFSSGVSQCWDWLRGLAATCTVCGDCQPVAAYGGWCCAKALAGVKVTPEVDALHATGQTRHGEWHTFTCWAAPFQPCGEDCLTARKRLDAAGVEVGP